MQPQEDISQWLGRLRDAEPGALDHIVSLLYGELRALASSYLRQERPDHTLQPTALVHEAYMRLVEQQKRDWSSRQHFMAIAAMAMRRVLVNHARDRGRLKRGIQRHPTLEDHVTVYAGATILGGETIIGAGSVISGGVFLTESVPSGHTVHGPKVELSLRSNPEMPPGGWVI